MELDNAVKIIYETTKHSGQIWLIGNGGSAATASHFATDLSRCTGENRQPIKAISLCDNLGLVTAIGNDFSFDDIFIKQLQNLGKAGDLLISISASGNSRNLIKAVEFANTFSISTLSLVGFDGGAIQELSNNSIYVQTAIGDYGIAEDCHSIICHYISSQLRE
jgi:D-sedoheptulose 7-phosphate isomerase